MIGEGVWSIHLNKSLFNPLLTFPISLGEERARANTGNLQRHF